MKHNKKTHINRNFKGFGQSGYAHMLVLGVGALVVVVGVGVFVYSANHKSSPQSINLTEAKSKSSTASASTAGSTKTSTSTNTATSSTSTPAVVKSDTSPTKSTPTQTSPTPSNPTTSSNNSSSSNSSNSSPTETPLTALTALITNIDNGGNGGEVTAQAVTIPGPISDATGQPLVFSVNDQTYFAYTQEQVPNFNQPASATANSMAIVNATGSYTLESAYLDKSGELTDPSFQLVGYSTGGD